MQRRPNGDPSGTTLKQPEPWLRCCDDWLERKSRLTVTEQLLESIPQGIAMFGADNRLVICNSQYATLYGLTVDDVPPGATLSDIIDRRTAKTGLSTCAIDVDERGRTCPPHDASPDTIEMLSGGRRVLVKSHATPDGGLITSHEDITDRLRDEKAILHLASHDPLTNIPNRLVFTERLDTALARARRGGSLALHWIDLDRFKHVNDTFGHPVGDAVLKEVANRLRSAVRETDTVARLGGDEFAVLQEPAPDMMAAKTLAVRIIEALDRPFSVIGRRLTVGASVGIATSTDGSDSAQSLMQKSDFALYQAKQKGLHTYRFFDDHLERAMVRRNQLQHDLARAIVQDEFEIHYQPILDLESRSVVSLEALLRWRHKSLGLISPMEFIPIAEETGLIVPIGDWVLLKACHDAARWTPTIALAVNLSAAQFNDGGPLQSISRALKASGLPPSRLEVEMTESTVINNVDAVLAVVRDIKSLGVRISLDDFGTGFSSLSSLSRFPFDKIKIDRSFVTNLPLDKGALAVLRTIGALGRSLVMKTTVEGIETEEQFAVAVQEGCNEVQGYFFSPPRPATDLLARLHSIEAKARLAGGRP